MIGSKLKSGIVAPAASPLVRVVRCSLFEIRALEKIGLSRRCIRIFADLGVWSFIESLLEIIRLFIL